MIFLLSLPTIQKLAEKLIRNVTRNEVEKLVREIMEEDERKVAEWKRDARKANVPGGSSLFNFKKMIMELRCHPQI